MDLVLWRHAQAHEGFPDLDRELTRKGERQAARMARWLDSRLPQDARCATSPAARARQTASFLDRRFVIDPRIAPGAAADDLLSAAAWPMERGTVLLVGHQPSLGAVASRLLDSRVPHFSIRKGSILWLRMRERAGSTEVVLRAVMPPNWV
jgi:phosphohistidine phosphatase